jgi:hypothetical protein
MIHPTGEGGLNVSKGGPATQEGKEVVRWNATRHGIRSPAPVVPGVEKAEDWENHRGGILESLQPEGHLEEVLAERVALLSWRLNRVTRYETSCCFAGPTSWGRRWPRWPPGPGFSP